MPAARPRATPPKKPARLAENHVDAEATATKIPMEWQGEIFSIDLEQTQFGRGAYALRRVGNDDLPLLERVNAMIDVVECAMGQEQLARIVELSPALFDDHATMRAFWETYTVAVHGSTSGESSAS